MNIEYPERISVFYNIGILKNRIVITGGKLIVSL